jgi:hypothetical protein
MKTLNIKDFCPPLLELARGLDTEPVALMHRGKPVAVFLPVRDADLETVSLSFNPAFLAIIERSRASHYQKGGFSSEEVRKEFGLPPYVPRKNKVNRRKSKVQRPKAASSTRER